MIDQQGRSFVCDVNGWSFVKNNRKYYDDCAQLLSEYISAALEPGKISGLSAVGPLLKRGTGPGRYGGKSRQRAPSSALSSSSSATDTRRMVVTPPITSPRGSGRSSRNGKEGPYCHWNEGGPLFGHRSFCTTPQPRLMGKNDILWSIKRSCVASLQ